MSDEPKSHIFFALLDHPLVKTWMNNTLSPASRSSKQQDLMGFISCFKLKTMEDIQKIKRDDIINWRDAMIGPKDDPRYAIRTVKRRMATISKFLEMLCDNKILKINVVQGVERPKLNTTEGATAIISGSQANNLLDAPEPKTLKGKRDRAIIATFLFHALRRSELCGLKIKDIQEREGIKQFKILGKGSKERYVPCHPVAITRINDYLNASGHGYEQNAPLFRPISNNTASNIFSHIAPNSVYELVKYYGLKVGIKKDFSTHSLRATAATSALNNREDIRKVQHWLGHAAVSTTAMYDKRDHRPEDSPTFRVKY